MRILSSTLCIRTLFCLLTLALFCGGCATTDPIIKHPTPPTLTNSNVAWYAFVSRTETLEANQGPYRVSATLRYREPEKSSTRVSALLWGNGDTSSPYPLRLDIMAGFGSVVAKIREDKQAFLAYNPDEEIAYFHTRDNRTLLSFGVPIPLTLGDLSLLLTGHTGTLFLPYGTTKEMPTPKIVESSGKTVKFALHNAPLSGILELASNGAPVSWSDGQPEGWVIFFTSSDSQNPLQPKTLSMKNGDGYEAIITIREVSKEPTPFSLQQLELSLPPGTKQQQLESAY